MSPKVLVAGIGNIFLGDDGFGVEVAGRLLEEDLPDWVHVEDFGIRGVHLAYELLEGYDAAILVDAAPRGGEPGTVYVIEPDLDAPGPEEAVRSGEGPLMDAHGMEPGAVLSLLKVLGGGVDRIVIVGCEPAEIEERIGLTDVVAGAVGGAVQVVRELIEEAGQAVVPAAVLGGGTSRREEEA